MNKKYCIFSAQFLPHMGGVEQYTYCLARELIRNGNEVTVVCTNTAGAKSYENLDGIDVYRFPSINFINGRLPIVKRNKIFKTIQNKLRITSFDMILVNSRFYFHSLYAVRFAHKMGIPCAMIEHGSSHVEFSNPLIAWVGQIYEHLLTSWEKHYCHDFYGVSGSCLEWLQHFGIQGKGVLYNAVDLDRINRCKLNPIRDFRAEYDIPEEAIVITYTGRLIKEKGIFQLISAVQEIQERNPNTYLLIAGTGEEENQVNEKVTKKIIWTGRLVFEEIVAMLMQSNIFCLPTDYPEGFPTSVLEAAACKNYIITTTRGGSKELLLDRTYGIVLNDNKKQSLVTAIQEAINMGENRKAAVEKTFCRLKEHFVWEKVAQEVEKLID